MGDGPDIARRYRGTLIRINPREPDVPTGHLALPMGALAAVRAIDGLLTIGKGQRIGLFAGSGVGKSTLMGQIARNCEAEIVVCESAASTGVTG